MPKHPNSTLCSGGKSSTARDDCESRRTRQGEDSNRRGTSLRAGLTKGRLELKGRVRVRNNLMTDVSQVRRANGEKAQYGQHNRGQGFHHGREKQSEDEQRGKEERLREQEQKLKEKQRKHQKIC